VRELNVKQYGPKHINVELGDLIEKRKPNINEMFNNEKLEV
jgi:hypothetical protein